MYHRIKELEEELEQAKKVKQISEVLAPNSVYDGRKTSSADNPFIKKDSTTSKNETTPAVTVNSNKEATTTVGETKATTVKFGEQTYRMQTDGPLPPKLATFDGKSEWKPYFMQFKHIADKYSWSKKQKLDKLIECLRDKALKYFSTRPESVREDFDLLVQKLNQRFGNRDLPHTVRRQLQDVKQNLEETVEEFSERVLELATYGYLNTPENVVEMVAVDSFLKGCQDKKAALFAMEKNPSTIDEAVQHVKASIHNHRIILGYTRKPEVKRVQFEDDSYDASEFSEAAVRQIKPKQSGFKENIDNLEMRMQATEKNIVSMKADIARILSAVSQRRELSRSRSPSPNKSNVRCYSCNAMGHYSNECPNKRGSPRKFNRSPSPNRGNNKSSQLNDQGSKI